VEKIKKLRIDVDKSLLDFDSYPVFQKSGDLVITGPTGANVSDLMILLTKNEK
jgi:glycerate-2-kinase